MKTLYKVHKTIYIVPSIYGKAKIKCRGDDMNRVRNLRKEKGLTQRKLSMDIHVSQQYISKVENGESSMTEEVILRLSKYFHVSIAYLLGVTEDRFSELVEENRDPDLREWLEFYYRLNKENQDTITYLSKHLLEKQSTEE